MPGKILEGCPWQKCHACMVLLASDRPPRKIYRHTFYLSGNESKPAVFSSLMVRLVSAPAGTVTAHISPRCSIEGEKPAWRRFAICVFAFA